MDSSEIAVIVISCILGTAMILGIFYVFLGPEFFSLWRQRRDAEIRDQEANRAQSLIRMLRSREVSADIAQISSSGGPGGNGGDWTWTVPAAMLGAPPSPPISREPPPPTRPTEDRRVIEL